MAHGNPLPLSLLLFISLSLSHPYSLFPFSSKILQTNFCFASNAQLTFCHSSRFLLQPDDSAVTCERYKYPQGGAEWCLNSRAELGFVPPRGRLCFTVHDQFLLDDPVTLPPVEILLFVPTKARVEEAENEFIQKNAVLN